MGIKGLTDRPPAFPRIGILRKGGPKPEKGPGPDLDYFRFTSDDETAVRAFYATYPAEPREINVYLPYRTPEENFEAWKEHWKAGGLVHRCDGEFVVIHQRNGEYMEPGPGTMQCPGECRPVGRLHVIVPELRRFAYVDAQTGSQWDIAELSANLAAMHLMRGDLRGIPFVLRRRPRMISTPGKNGRARREMWLLSIEPAPAWVRAKLEEMTREALPGGEPLALTMDDSTIVEIDDGRAVDLETGEIVAPLANGKPQPAGNEGRPVASNGGETYYNAAAILQIANKKLAAAEVPEDLHFRAIAHMIRAYKSLTGKGWPTVPAGQAGYDREMAGEICAVLVDRQVTKALAAESGPEVASGDLFGEQQGPAQEPEPA